MDIKEIIDKEIKCLEFIEYMRDIKNKDKKEYLDTIKQLEILAEKKAKKVKEMKCFTVDELIKKMLYKQNKHESNEIKKEKYEIIEKVLNISNVNIIKNINYLLIKEGL